MPSPAAPVSPSSPSSQSDRLAISSEARNLQQLGGAAQDTTSELSADRMREVVKRMNDGHYDKPDVMDEVIRRMAKDL
jgi:cytochrome c-type biogenesis protein CcmH/NrfF